MASGDKIMLRVTSQGRSEAGYSCFWFAATIFFMAGNLSGDGQHLRRITRRVGYFCKARGTSASIEHRHCKSARARLGKRAGAGILRAHKSACRTGADHTSRRRSGSFCGMDFNLIKSAGDDFQLDGVEFLDG